jgi:transposase
MLQCDFLATEEHAMMGHQSAQEELFYQFRFEDHIPSDHLLRQLDELLNFNRVRLVLAHHYSPHRSALH